MVTQQNIRGNTMIKNLVLTNFRQHEFLDIDFKEGLNVIRGPNESGKSTLIEGVLYALYGAKALRDTLAETVLWGRGEKDLKVVLVLNVEGIDYTFSRSKGSAECRWVNGEGYLVTGQNEVTAHATNILGADAKTAASLMLADQAGLRGALDDGPAAVSGLMGKLADFDMVDRILAAMDSKLLLGSVTPYQEKLAAAEQERDAAKVAIPDDTAIVAIEKAIGDYQAFLGTNQMRRDNVLAPAYSATMEAFNVEKTKHDCWDNLNVQISNACHTQDTIKLQLAEAKVKASVKVDTSRISGWKAEIEDEKNYDVIAKAYNKFLKLPEYPDGYWDGTYETFSEEMKTLENAHIKANAEHNTAVSDLRVLKASVNVGGICSSCGTDISKRADIVEKNRITAEEIAKVEQQIEKLLDVLANVGPDLDAMKAIAKDAASRVAAVQGIGAFVEVDTNFYPPRISWRGAVPDLSDARRDTSAIQKLIDNAEASAREVAKAEGMVTVLEGNLAAAVAKVEELQKQQQSITLGDLAAVEKAYRDATTALNEIDDTIYNLNEEIKNKTKVKDDLVRCIESYKLAFSNAERRVTELNEDIKKLSFNNGLLKKMRGLKPAITDHLWSLTLSAVSNFFSQLRGENSVVTKGAAGFMVNSHSCASLSGSTLDALAIAIRVALSKTFVPQANFLILDEPAHGADINRTASILGFLASVGYGQVILASHDELSETVSDNVILLGV